jgi:hypothetical protein
MKKNKILLISASVLALPILMFIFWWLKPSKKMVVAIIDKTVLTTDGQEHISLTWILNHERLTKTNTKRYGISNDYFGFFPKENEKFKIKGLERFSRSQLKQLSEDADLVYFTDTYGIFQSEWYKQTTSERTSGILYGGLSNNDLDFLEMMKEKNKLIITEFNTIGSPTTTENRNRFESLFAMNWTGWTARYFDSLDTLKNTELPKWLIKNYKAANQNRWLFKRAGIAFVSEKDEVVILESNTHLTNELPMIVTNKFGVEKFGLPERIKYPFWFDIIIPNHSVNESVSNFEISTNEKGKKELAKYGIPAVFPAVLMHQKNDYQFFYFSGDFCDNHISMKTSYFAGIDFFKFLMYDTEDSMERNSFFWNFYKPLMTTILKDQIVKRN